MTHLIECGFQDLDGFHLGRIGEGFHQFGIVGGLHGGAVELALDGAQVFGYAQDAEVDLVHAGAAFTVHGALSC